MEKYDRAVSTKTPTYGGPSGRLLITEYEGSMGVGGLGGLLPLKAIAGFFVVVVENRETISTV